MSIDMKEFVAGFVEEAREYIVKINEGLLSLEKNPDDPETMNELFRLAHTIKGSSKMVQLTAITELSHKMEDALGAVREKKIPYSKGLSDLLFKGIDIVAEMIEQAAAEQEISMDIGDICEELEKASTGADEGEVRKEAGKTGTSKQKKASPQIITLDDLEERPSQIITLSDLKKSSPEGDDEEEESAEPDSQTTAESPSKSVKTKPDETIRIKTEKLDETIKLMGEIVSGHSRFKQRLSDIKEVEKLAKQNLELLTLIEKAGFSQDNGDMDEIIKTSHALCTNLTRLASGSSDDTNLQELLTGELQEKALRMRMLPLSTVFDTFPRTVRDLSKSIGKEVELVVEGGETELDKKIIEMIGNPLMHMVRNAIDHGIEMPEERLKAGKPGKGVIRLSASHEGRNVLIEMSDDGAGLSLKEIKQKALKSNLFAEETLKEMSRSEILDIIFLPGFSTSELITDVSGRGVGMDVVRKNIVDDLKGSVRIETEEGKGSTFSLKLPLTLAIMRVLQLTVSEMTFAVPVSSISEILRAKTDELINVVDRRAIRLRDELIPVVNLDELLKLPAKNQAGREELLILIFSQGSERLGVIVDSLIDEEDMVIKPLPSHMKNIQWVSGATISGKNEIISVLHVPMIIESAKEIKGGKTVERAVEQDDKLATSILVVEDSVTTREIEKSILESYGYHVDVAGDGMEALEKTQEFKYDLVVTDVEMPRMDGFSLTERLRKEATYKHTPIIILTSREKEEDKKRGIRIGANAYIVKGSMDESNLLEAVQTLVG